MEAKIPTPPHYDQHDSNPGQPLTVTCGDTSSIIFGIVRGNGITKLRADKEKLESGQKKTCEGKFTISFMTGEKPAQIYPNSACDILLEIDFIDETKYGFQVIGTITGVAPQNSFQDNCRVGPRRGMAYCPNKREAQPWTTELDLIHKGARIALIHRGAGCPGAITCIRDTANNHTHLPYIPPETLEPRQIDEHKSNGQVYSGNSIAVFCRGAGRYARASRR